MSDEALKQIAKDVAAIRSALAAGAVAFAAALGATLPAAAGGVGSVGGGGVATATELDGQYGDPEIRRDPKRWAGASCVGLRFSETTAEYLDVVAEFKDWQAEQDDKAGAKDSKGKPKSFWGRKDARLARGWAARMRGGWKPKSNGPGGGSPISDEDYGDGGDGDVPF